MPTAYSPVLEGLAEGLDGAEDTAEALSRK